jgi:GntR family transcriptional repressor for pyruvate dehydrogenase complex
MSRLHRKLMRVLIADITSGEYAPGRRLSRETDLARDFGVSRGVVREAIRGLEERGLVDVKHGRGATVNPDTAWDVFSADVLSSLLTTSRAADVLREYLECRRILEIEAAGLAAERATARDLAALADHLAQMTASAARAAGNRAAEDFYHEADIAFHRAVIASTGNQALARMTEPVQRALAEARRPLARPEHRFGRGIPEHERILAAIADRDAHESRAAMGDHLLTVEGYLREYADAAGETTQAAGEADGRSPVV